MANNTENSVPAGDSAHESSQGGHIGFVYADALTRAIECSNASDEDKERMLKLYEEVREGHKKKVEEVVGDVIKYSVPDYEVWVRRDSLWNIVDCVVPRYTAFVNTLEDDEIEATERELDQLEHDGPTIKLPYDWGYDEETKEYHKTATFTISKKQWDAGERWTLRKVWKQMRSFYGANKQKRMKSMGDHVFFEGFMEDGLAYFGS
jgi:hypothetical protein